MAIRYPRGSGSGVEMPAEPVAWEAARAQIRSRGTDVALLGVGRTVPMCEAAAEILAGQGVSASVVNARWVKPLDFETVSWAASEHRLVVTVEDNTSMGGFGGAVCEALADLGLATPVLRMAIPDCFVTHGAMPKLLSDVGLTAESIAAAALGRLERHPAARRGSARTRRSQRRRRPVTRSRIDVILVERGLFPSREQARAALLAGEVRVSDQVVTKAGQLVDEAAPIQVAERQRFVSRGGEKLAGALDNFALDVSGLRVVDVGASTGGFTDCVLQRGASSVCAVDVGYGQLAWSLRTDPRVTVFERTNIRGADPAELGAPFDLAVIDVSFISLRKVLPNLVSLLDARRRTAGGAGKASVRSR